MANQANLINLVHDTMAKGCVAALQENSLILNVLPMKDNAGSMTHLYSVVKSAVNAQFREVGENVAGDCIAPEQMVETLKVLTSDILIDRLYFNGRIGNLTDVRIENTTVAMMSLANLFEDTLFYGTGENAKEFKGLVPRIADGIGKEFAGNLEMSQFDEVLDYISYGAGTKVIICNAKTRRSISKMMRTEGHVVQTVEAYGQSVISYDGAIIYTSEAVKDGEIFFINFEESVGVSGLTLGGLTATEQGFEGTQHRTAVELVAGVKTPHPRCFAILKVGSPARAKK